MQSRNSIRWLSFVLMTSASAAAFANDHDAGLSLGAGVGVGAGVSSGAGIGVDLGAGARGNVEGRPVQGMTGADADAGGEVNANTGDRPGGAAPITRAREKMRSLFRGRGDSSVSGGAQGEVSGSGQFGTSID